MHVNLSIVPVMKHNVFQTKLNMKTKNIKICKEDKVIEILSYFKFEKSANLNFWYNNFWFCSSCKMCYIQVKTIKVNNRLGKTRKTHTISA